MVDHHPTCLTCFQPSGFYCLSVHSEENNTIKEALRKHFWFTDIDFQLANICQSCWHQVNGFHQFYVSVQDLYHNQTASVIVKNEPEVDAYECLDEVIPECSGVKTEADDDRIKEHLTTFSDDTYAVDNTSAKKPLSSIDMSETEMSENDSLVEPLPDRSSAVDLDDGIADPAEEENSDYKASDDEEYDTENVAAKQNEKSMEGTAKTNLERKSDEDIRKHVKYICVECGEESETFSGFKDHALKAHSNANPFLECCGKKFYRRYILWQHVLDVTNPNKYQCPICPKRMKNKDGYRRHVREVHAAVRKKFTCDLCSTSFMKNTSLQAHKKKHVSWNDQFWNSTRCDSSIQPQAPTKANTNDTNDSDCIQSTEKCLEQSRPEIFKFERDDTSQSQDSTLVVMEKPASDVGYENEVVCIKSRTEKKSRENPKRGKWYKKQEDDIIRSHVNFSCKQCDVVSDNFAQYFRHSLEVHKVELHSIECCGKQFLVKDRLSDHVRVFYNPDVFRCKKCYKHFNYKFGLNLHMKRVHPAEAEQKLAIKNYVAGRSSDEQSLDAHVQDCGSGPFNCDVCKLEIPSKAALEAHKLQEHSDNELMPGQGMTKAKQALSNLLLRRRLNKPLVNDVDDSKNKLVPDTYKAQTMEEDSAEENQLRSHNQEASELVPLAITSNPEVANTFQAQSETLPNNEPTEHVAGQTEEMTYSDQSDGTEDDQEDDKEHTHTTKKRRRTFKTLEQIWMEEDEIRNHLKLMCGQCGEDSQTFHLFKKHAIEVHGIHKPFVICCRKKFTSRFNLLNHVQSTNNPDHNRCDVCQKCLGDRQGLLRHMKKSHPTAKTAFKCIRCFQSFSSNLTLVAHMQEHVVWDNQALRCLPCKKIFPDEESLHAHELECRNEANIRENCTVVLPAHNPEQHDSHNIPDCKPLESQDSGEEVQPELVTEESHDDHGLVSLIVKSEPELAENASPEQISNKNDSEQSDDQPVAIEHSPVSCSRAEESMEEDNYIRQHVQYNCLHCDERSEKFSSYRKHAIEKHGVRKPFFRCCARKYITRQGLWEHVYAINHPDRFRCQECQKSLNCQAALDRHMEFIHSSLGRKFNCNRCPKSYNLECLLIKHLDLHDAADNRSWDCKLCDKVYPDDKRLSQHMRRVHREATEFVCETCSKICRSESLLAYHKLIHNK